MSSRPPALRRSSSTDLSPKTPYPGPRSFGENDRTYFFGRDAEIVELFERIRARTLTVLRGKSGMGKTSLLQAGLFPALRKNSFFPLRILFTFDADAQPLATQIRSRMKAEIAEGKLDAKPPADDETLWHYFQHTAFWDAVGESVIPVLVLDQFEETLQPKRRGALSALVVELADLVENKVPLSILAKASEESEAATSLRPERGPRVKVVLSLREDFFAELEELRPRMPSLGTPHMRLGALGWKNALKAVMDPAAQAKLLGPAEGAQAVAERIVLVVAGDEKGNAPSEGHEGIEVESSLLALYCYELNWKRIEEGLPAIAEPMVNPEKRDALLRGFYERCIAQVSVDTRLLVEDKLLTGGRRDTIAQDNLPEARVAEINKLVDLHLLRRELRLGRQYVEIVHDVLVKPISEFRNERIATEIAEAQIATQQAEQKAARDRLENERIEADKQRDAAETRARLAETEQKLEAEQRQQERSLFVAGVGVLLAVVLGVWWWQSDSKQKADGERAGVWEKYRQAEQIGERAASSLAEAKQEDAARALSSALEALKDARSLEDAFVKKHGALEGTEERPLLLPLLAHRFVAGIGASRLLLQDREGLQEVVTDWEGRFGAALLADRRTIRFFDADHPETEPWRAAPLLVGKRETKEDRVPSGKMVWTEDFDDSIRDLAMSRDGTMAFVAGDRGTVVAIPVQTKDGKPLFGFRTRMMDPHLRADRAGRMVVLTSSRMEDADDGDCVAVNLANAEKRPTDVIRLEPPERRSESAKWALLEPSDDGGHVVGLWYEPDPGTCQWRVWSANGGPPEDGEKIASCEGRAARSKSGKYVAVMRTDGKVQPWVENLARMEKRGFPMQPASGSINWLHFDPQNEDLLLLGADDMVEAWSVESGTSITVAAPGHKPEAATLLAKTDLHSREMVVRAGDGIVAFDEKTNKAVGSWSLPAKYVEDSSEGGVALQSTHQVVFRPEKREALVITGNAVRSLSLRDGASDAVLWGRGSQAEAERTVELSGVDWVYTAKAQGNRLAMLAKNGLFFVDDLTGTNPAAHKWKASGADLLGFDWKTSPTNAQAGYVAAFDVKFGVEIGTTAGSYARVRVPDAAPTRWTSHWNDIALSDDGKWVALRVNTKIYVWTADTTKEVWEWKLPSSSTQDIKAFAITTYENTPCLAIGDDKGAIYVVRTAGDKPEEMKLAPNIAGIHRGAIELVAWAGNERFATADERGAVAIFRVEWQPQPRVSLASLVHEEHRGKVTALRFSLDNERLLSGGVDGNIHVSGTKGGHICTMPHHTRGMFDIELDPRPGSNRVLSTDWDGKSILWMLETCEEKASYANVMYAGFAKGSIVTVAKRMGRVGLSLWADDSMESGRDDENTSQTPSGVLPWGGVWNGHPIAADDAGHVFTWRGSVPKKLTNPSTAIAKRASLVASAGSRLLAIAKDGNWLDWSGDAEEPRAGEVKLPKDAVLRSAVLSPDAKTLLLVEEQKTSLSLHMRVLKDEKGTGFTENKPNTIPLEFGPGCGDTRAPTGEKERAIAATTVDTAIRIVAADPGGCVEMWNEDGKALLEAPSNMGSAAVLVALSPRGDRLVLADEKNALSVLTVELSTGSKNGSLRRIGWDPDRHQNKIRAITFHPQGRFFVTVGEDGRAWLWDARAGKAIVRLGDHPGPIWWAAFDTTGNRVYTGGAEAWLRGWDTRTTIDQGMDSADKLLEAIYDWLPELRPLPSTTSTERH